jgi:hypothetical protein
MIRRKRGARAQAVLACFRVPRSSRILLIGAGVRSPNVSWSHVWFADPVLQMMLSSQKLGCSKVAPFGRRPARRSLCVAAKSQASQQVIDEIHVRLVLRMALHADVAVAVGAALLPRCRMPLWAGATC